MKKTIALFQFLTEVMLLLFFIASLSPHCLAFKINVLGAEIVLNFEKLALLHPNLAVALAFVTMFIFALTLFFSFTLKDKYRKLIVTKR